MVDTPDIARVASLVADPARSRMLAALMDGRALTATELSLEGRVAPSTASSHIAKMAEGGLLATARQGRHRYFRIASRDVARALEALMAIAPPPDKKRAVRSFRDEGLRRARVCYDHLAGEAGVRLLADLEARGLLRSGPSEASVTESGAAWLLRFGIDLASLRSRRRPLVRRCLDWSERRFHLGGAVGAALLERLLALRYARRETGTRTLTLTPRGLEFLEGLSRRAGVAKGTSGGPRY